MNRLQTELHRLYLSTESLPEGQDPADAGRGLIDADGRVRAMVLEIVQPAGWDAVAALWQGIQDDLDLPEPAIAVSGIDGYQVWLSLAEPVPVTQAADFLESLRLRYLGAVAPRHIRITPDADASAVRQAQHTRMVPALQVETGHWSAFVAPGLAGMFADEPWLDLPPGPDAQANLLSRFQPITPVGFRLAQERLGPAAAPAAAAVGAAAGSGVAQVSLHDGQDPKRFLLAVMNDPATEMHLRIEAAKALLPYFEGERRG